MSRFCVTMNGTAKEIIEGLATVRELSRGINEPIDFVIGKDTMFLAPLFQQQYYIDQVYAYEDELLSSMRYSMVFPLEGNGRNDQPFIDQVAAGHRVKLFEPLPYITVADPQQTQTGFVLVSYGFDPANQTAQGFLEFIRHHFRTTALFADVNGHLNPANILNVAKTIADSDFFIGDHSYYRSLAHAINKPVLCYEPDASLRTKVNEFPYGDELTHENTTGLQVWKELFQLMCNKVQKGMAAE